MPATRGCWTIHPVTGVPGVWFEISLDTPGTIRGMSTIEIAAAISTSGETLASYGSKVTTLIQRQFASRTFRLGREAPGHSDRNLPVLPPDDEDYKNPPPGYFIDPGTQRLVAKLIDLTITVSSLTPVTIGGITVGSGALREVRV